MHVRFFEEMTDALVSIYCQVSNKDWGKTPSSLASRAATSSYCACLHQKSQTIKIEKCRGAVLQPYMLRVALFLSSVAD